MTGGQPDRLKIVVLMGGTSSERDVSLASGIRIAEALRSLGHAVIAVDPARGEISADEQQALAAGGVVRVAPPSQESLRQMAREALPRLASNLPRRGDADVVVLGLHGGIGEDGTIQSMLELTGVPYTGSHTLGSALAMDKDLSKALFRQAGVTTADWLMAPATAAEVGSRIGYPAIVKPSKQGSTVGLSVVKEPGALSAAIDEAVGFRRRGNDRAIHSGARAHGGHPGRRGASGWRNHPEARDLRLRVQVHRGHGRGAIPGGAHGGRDGADSGTGTKGVRRAQAPRVCTHRFSNVERQHVLLSRGEHAPGHDEHESHSAGGRGGGDHFPGAVRAHRASRARRARRFGARGRAS